MLRLRALGPALALALCAGQAQASPAEQFGFGPRQQAMGMTGVAVGRGFGTAYGNPALLSFSRQREVSLGFQEATFHVKADGPNAPGDLHEQALAGSFIGAVLPLPFGGPLKERLTFGLGAFTPRDLIVRARVPYPEAAQYPLLGDRAHSLSFALGAGVDLGSGLRVGVGALAMAALVGSVVVRTEASGRTGTVVDDQLIATWAPLVGASQDLGQGWVAGLAFRGKLQAEFDVAVRVNDLGSLVLPELHIAGLAQYDPMQLGAEVGKKLGPWTLALGVTYQRWSAFPGWERPTVTCPDDQPDCQALVPEPVDFHDTLSPRLGAAVELFRRRAATGELRFGWLWQPSPAPVQKRAANHWDSDRHALTLGFGLELRDPLPPLLLDFFFQEHLLVPRTHHKDADVDAANVGSPQVTTRGSAQVGGLVLGVRF